MLFYFFRASLSGVKPGGIEWVRTGRRGPSVLTQFAQTRRGRKSHHSWGHFLRYDRWVHAKQKTGPRAACQRQRRTPGQPPTDMAQSFSNGKRQCFRQFDFAIGFIARSSVPRSGGFSIGRRAVRPSSSSAEPSWDSDALRPAGIFGAKTGCRNLRRRPTNSNRPGGVAIFLHHFCFWGHYCKTTC